MSKARRYNSDRLRWGLVLALSLAVGAESARAETGRDWWAGELSAAAGLDWSEGDYDEPGPDTEILYLPFSVAYRLDDFGVTDYPLDQVELRVTVPYLEIDSPLAFFAETPGVDRPPGAGTSHERGLGDVVMAATYGWFPLDEFWPALELTGKVKFPSADADRNLGSGSTDFSAQIALFKTWGRVTGFADAGYRFPGDPPGGRLRNSGYASGGASVRIAPRIAAGAYYSWLGASSSTRHDSHEIIGFGSLRISEQWSLEPYAVWGVAGYVPDYAVGMSIRVRMPVGRR